MEYRGKRYTVEQGGGAHSWKWTVHLGGKKVESGTSRTRASATTSAVWAIDKALALAEHRQRAQEED